MLRTALALLALLFAVDCQVKPAKHPPVSGMCAPSMVVQAAAAAVATGCDDQEPR